MSEKKNRRAFLRESFAIGAGVVMSNRLFALAAEQAKHAAGATGDGGPEPGNGPADGKMLRGFIVSDAHVGWDNPVQPTLEKQKQMIDAIRRRFPDLDIFIDTGDAHHDGQERSYEKGQWSDVILYQDEPVPFMYVPGNHEITGARDFDVELSCDEMGSHECRPYYSFDVKGIHFVSVPELLRAVWLPKELMEWLALDLEVNRDRTTILLSHNSLIGYSKVYEEGYRGVVNTEELISLVKKYPNVVAWMYGHNHNYEVVPKLGKLFVSNGRIGGFDPSKGKHGLGGIYFEIGKGRVDIRCYSAEFDKFVDQFDSSELFHGVLDMPTSFDPKAPAAQSFGVGRDRNGDTMPIFHHFVSDAPTQEAWLAGVAGKTINDDPTFIYYMVRHSSREGDKQLMGCSISGRNTYTWKNPGLVINGNQRDRVVMTITKAMHNKVHYFRVASGQNYRVALDIEGQDKGQSIKITNCLYDRFAQQVQRVESEPIPLSGARQTLVREVKFSTEKRWKSIYMDENSDNVFNFSTEIEFTPGKNDITLHRVGLEFSGANETTEKPSLKYDDTLLSASGNLSEGRFEHFTLPANTGNRSVVTVGANGNGMATWLVRQNDLQYQVLGARVANRDKSIAIGPLRNRYSQRKEVMINPFHAWKDKTFLFKMRNVNSAEVFHVEIGNPVLVVKVLDTLAGAGTGVGTGAGSAELEFYSPKELTISGGGDPVRRGMKYIVPVKNGSVVTVKA